MDRGIWAIWYGLDDVQSPEYERWFHEVHIPEKLSRPAFNYFWYEGGLKPNKPEFITDSELSNSIGYGSTSTLSTPVCAARSNAFKPCASLNSSMISTVGSTWRDSIKRSAGSKGPQREPTTWISSTTMEEKLTVRSPL